MIWNLRFPSSFAILTSLRTRERIASWSEHHDEDIGALMAARAFASHSRCGCASWKDPSSPRTGVRMLRLSDDEGLECLVIVEVEADKHPSLSHPSPFPVLVRFGMPLIGSIHSAS